MSTGLLQGETGLADTMLCGTTAVTIFWGETRGRLRGDERETETDRATIEHLNGVGSYEGG